MSSSPASSTHAMHPRPHRPLPRLYGLLSAGSGMAITQILLLFIGYVSADLHESCAEGYYYSPNSMKCKPARKEGEYCNSVQICDPDLECNSHTCNRVSICVEGFYGPSCSTPAPVVKAQGKRLMPTYEATSVPLSYVDCFWKEPFYYGGRTGDAQGWAGSINANIDDYTATYWAARIKLPDNAKMVFKGEFGQNRYASFSSYGVTDPTSSLDDFMIEPDEGSTNPYQEGALRTLPADQRRFTVTVINADKPEDERLQEPNTLYARPPETDMTLYGAPDRTMVDLRWRSYTPDRKFDLVKDARGGGKLPFPEYIELPAGSPGCEGPKACRRPFQCDMDPTQKSQQARGFTNSGIPIKELRDLWENPMYSCTNETVKETYGGWCNDPWVAPATDPPRFEKFFGIQYSYDGMYDPPAKREADREKLKASGLNCSSGMEIIGAPGIPANFNSNYGSMYIAQKFGKVFHIKAKKPRTPTTYWEDPVFDSGDAQMRYWSWTIGNERTTGQISGGLNDEMFPEVDGGYYSMVISLPEDRPKTATQACGHAWLNWGRRGDGTGRWGITCLVLRHMMLMNDFDKAMQQVCEPGKEKELLGEYYPEGAYFKTPEEFDASVGCLELDP